MVNIIFAETIFKVLSMINNFPKINLLKKSFSFLMLALVSFVLSSPLSTAKASDTFVFTVAHEDESRLRQRFNSGYLFGRKIRRANQLYS